MELKAKKEKLEIEVFDLRFSNSEIQAKLDELSSETKGLQRQLAKFKSDQVKIVSKLFESNLANMVNKKASGFSSDHQQESLIVQIESLIEVKNKVEAEKEHVQSENKNLKK